MFTTTTIKPRRISAPRTRRTTTWCLAQPAKVSSATTIQKEENINDSVAAIDAPEANLKKQIANNEENGPNRTGLNGLTQGGTDGLSSGHFTVSASIPIQYAVKEVPSSLFNKASTDLLVGVVPDSYPLRCGCGKDLRIPLRRLIVIDENVYQHHGDDLHAYMKHHDVEYEVLTLPTREENKEMALVFEVAERMRKFGVDRRRHPVIAIGGGVCLDIVGLAVNLYRRGTPVIKCPTTLMGVVDASIGVKTGVNFNGHKNKLGTYSPPLATLIDRSLMSSLDTRNIRNGAAEIVKMACVKDDVLFELLEDHADALVQAHFCPSRDAAPHLEKVASNTIRRSIQGMLEELEPNLHEHILIRLVDYGHTLSPPLEMAALESNAPLLHGEAVAIDMAVTTELSAMRGLITPDERRRTISILKALELPLWHPSLNRDVVAYALRDAASLRSGYQRIPLMTGIGEASFFSDIQVDEVVTAVESARIEHASLYGDASATLEGYNWPGEPVQSSQRRDVQAARVRKLPEHLRN